MITNALYEIEVDEVEKYRPTHNLHLLAPYVGKVRPALAKYLIEKHCANGGVLCDPFCGSGTIPLEGWLNGQKVISSDLNLYAQILTKGKLNPPVSLEIALEKLEKYNKLVNINTSFHKIDKDDKWVAGFFHPKTFQETIKWSKVLQDNNEFFFLSCLLGILHHQRPGFLSYPSSHGAPYLRSNKYPISKFPEMYEYRDVYSRLLKKVIRSLKNFPKLNFDIERLILFQNAYDEFPVNRINTIITSPPYMKSLTYARDNRLRLWFLGESDWKELDKEISPSKIHFEDLINKSFHTWSSYQRKGDKCIIIIGDLLFDTKNNIKLTDIIKDTAQKVGYNCDEVLIDPIPEARKVIKGNTNIKTENVCVFIKR